MSRRTLAVTLAMIQRDLAGYGEDPLAGVINERAFLYSPRAGRIGGGSWGFDGTLGSSERVRVHRDGYSSAHLGACAAEPEVPLVDRLIAQAGLDHREADLLRRSFADPDRGSDWHATEMRLSLRTYQRTAAAVEAKIRRIPKL
jgi:hypothetical protein